MYGYCGCAGDDDFPTGPFAFYGGDFLALNNGLDQAEANAAQFTSDTQQQGNADAGTQPPVDAGGAALPQSVIYPLNTPISQTAVFDPSSECGGYHGADRPVLPPDPQSSGMAGCQSEPGPSAAPAPAPNGSGWVWLAGLALLAAALPGARQ